MTGLFKSGTYLKHAACPEWGIGRVDAADGGDYISVTFEHGGQRKLSLRQVTDKLEIVPAEAVPAGTRFVAQPARASTARSSQKTNGECVVCGGALNRSQRPESGGGQAWKSCPNCSSSHGTQHIYRPFPDTFGQSEARVNDNTPDGAQSYCNYCRSGRAPEGPQRSCDSFKS
jgi:hypothetical protein